MTKLEALTAWISGAPICAGEASPLRVATGGNANWSSKSVAAARPPAQINGAITRAVCQEKKQTGPKALFETAAAQKVLFTLEPN
jgi:hypothetical protein